MSKNILFLSYYFPPFCNTPSIRAMEISKRLKDFGFKIFVLCRKSLKSMPIDNELLNHIKSPEIHIFKVTHFTIPFNYIENFLHRISKRLDFFNPTFIFNWIPISLLICSRIIKNNKFSLIYATAPPFFSFYLGYLLNKMYKIPLILEYRDPWTNNPYLLRETSFKYKQLFQKLEKKILKSADVVLTISSALKDYLLRDFSEELYRKKVLVIPNGLNIVPSIESISKKKNNKIIFTFTGTLYGIRDLKPLIIIVSKLKKEGELEDISLSINIYGTYNNDYLKHLIVKYNVSKYFHLGGYISHNECYNKIKKSTLPLHIGENLNYPTISFKVWEYLSMKKKILYLGIESSYTSRFLKQNGLGYIIPINDLDLGVKKFIKLLQDIKTNSIKTEIELSKISNFTWDKYVQKLVKIFKKF